jgi:hypothetical protein
MCPCLIIVDTHRIAKVTRRVQARVLRELERRGMLRDPNDARNEAEDEPMIGCAQLSRVQIPF